MKISYKAIKVLILSVVLAVCACALCAQIVKADNAPYTENDKYDSLDMRYTDISKVSLAEVFKDGMLIQWDKPVPVWGGAPSGTSIKAELQNAKGETLETVSTTADSDGYFYCELSPRAASFDEYRIVINDGEIRVDDVVFGDLFLASGQSNMALNVQYCTNADEIRETADKPFIRVFLSPDVPNAAIVPYYPAEYYEGGEWVKGDNYVSLRTASAVAYNFILDIYAELNKNGTEHIPVGFINASKGSTNIETWIARQAIENAEDSSVKDFLEGKNRLLSGEEYNQQDGMNFNQVSAMFNAKIAPVTNLYISGVLWYQGENNVGNESACAYYEKALNLLIEDWTKWFNDGETQIPFIFVQPTPHNFGYKPEAMAYFWEALSNVYLQNQNRCAMVTTYDIPLDWNNKAFAFRSPIHPITKKPVGERCAYFMINMLYGGNRAKSSPVYSGFKVEKNSVVVSFYNAESGLMSLDGLPIKGFSLCGEDRIFYSADAKINQDGTVTVSSRYVENPVAVAYSFSTMITESNLCTKEEIPVAPFRSDTAVSSYYRPKNWQDCDNLEYFVSEGGGKEDDIACMQPAYTCDPLVKLTLLEQGDKGRGVKISYTLNEEGTFAFSPVLNYGGTSEDFTLYDNFSFKIKNSQDRDITLSVKVTLSDGRSGYLLCRDNSSQTVTVNKGSDSFVNFDFDLTALFNGTEKTDISAARDLIQNIELLFSDDTSGFIGIDSFGLGNFLAIYETEEEPENPEDPEDPTDSSPSDGTEDPLDGAPEKNNVWKTVALVAGIVVAVGVVVLLVLFLKKRKNK